jgi:hypothetical protein
MIARGRFKINFHLAIALAITAARKGRRVYYDTLADLGSSLEQACTSGSLKHRLSVLSAPSLKVVDGTGCLPVSQTGTMVYYQLMNRRYERATTVLTSRERFEEWGELLGAKSWRLRSSIGRSTSATSWISVLIPATCASIWSSGKRQTNHTSRGDAGIGAGRVRFPPPPRLRTCEMVPPRKQHRADFKACCAG